MVFVVVGSGFAEAFDLVAFVAVAVAIAGADVPAFDLVSFVAGIAFVAAAFGFAFAIGQAPLFGPLARSARASRAYPT